MWNLQPWPCTTWGKYSNRLVKKSKNQPFFFNIWGYVNRLGVALVQMVSDL